MEDMKRKEIIIGVLIISVFVFVVSLSSLYIQTEISSGNICGCAIPIPLFIPFIASVGLFIGSLIYSLFSPRFKRPKIDKDIFLNFLVDDERKVFDIILSEKVVTQSEIVKRSGLSKVKVFRILRRFEDKGLIEKERDRKTNLIRLSEDISKFL
ncbi:MAG: MarR family transcriptional regulator [Candidatus Aenigmarchaeota archaeon]|nr:MarR family transcriptional regulator [Candidatus Aenigmarchaeota archaeon]